MNLLYIIFSLVLDVGPHYPTGHPALPPSTPSEMPSAIPTSDPTGTTNSLSYLNLKDVNYQTKFEGIDDRYPVGLYDPDEFIRIAKLIDSFEKLSKIRQMVQNNEFVEDINDILGPFDLGINEIGQFKIKSGGLFDDWERNI
jgi:hypothetical protein